MDKSFHINFQFVVIGIQNMNSYKWTIKNVTAWKAQSCFYAAKDKIENCITNQFWTKHILFECGFWKFMHSIEDSLRELLLNVFKKCFLCFIFSTRILSYLTLENNDFSCNEKKVASFCSKHSSLWILWHPYENTWVIFGLCITEKQFFILSFAA